MLVSVVIPTFQRSDNLERSIASVLNQTYNDIEIIVVDDNGENTSHQLKTEILMKKYATLKKIKYIKHKKNLNGAAARNTGIKIAKGKYIAFLDDDDEFLDTKIEHQIDFLETYKEFNACYCFCNKFNKKKLFYTTKFEKEGNLTLDVLTLQSEVYTPSLIFKKEALIKIGCFNDKFKRHQDYELLLKYFKYYKIGCLKEVGVNIYIDDMSNHATVSDYEKIKNNFFKIFNTEISQFNIKTQKKIYQEHYFELLYFSIKQKNFKKILYYLYKSKPSLQLILNNKEKILKVLKQGW